MGVGISFGTLLVALLSFIAFSLYSISQRKPSNREKAEEATSQPKSSEHEVVDTGIQSRTELSGAENPKEMYTLHNTHEAEARSGA